MRALPLFRFNKRARSTSWGIALCTMFIVASFSIASGLRTSMDTLADNFVSEYSLVSVPGDSGMDFFAASSLGTVEQRSAFCIVSAASTGSGELIVFSVSDPHGVLVEIFDASGDEVRTGASVDLVGNVTLVGETVQEVTVVSEYSSSMFSSSWVLGSEELLLSLTGQEPGSCNLAVAKDMSQTERAILESSGFSVQPMISIVEFLDSSVDELESDAYWVLVPSAFVIAVLAYGFIGAEVADKRHDIGIIKTLGAGRKRVLSYILGESLLISAYGGALGLALGIVLSYGVSTAASHIFTSVFVVEIEEMLLAVSFAVTVSAAMLGSVLPAARMALSTPVSDLREGIPY